MLVRDLMTPNPMFLDPMLPLVEAARCMADLDIGQVLVTDGSVLHGVVTDRDLVVRGMASDLPLEELCLGDICSQTPITTSPEASVEDAIELMRQYAIRRLPVTEGATAVGILSIGDLAIAVDPSSALADISRAPADG